MSRFKMSTKIFVLALSAVAIFFLFTNKRLIQLEPMRVLERFCIIQNNLKVSTDLGFDDLQISWVGFIKSDRRYDTLVIYKNGKELQKIPDAYGKTFLIVTTNNRQCNKIGILKFKP